MLLKVRGNEESIDEVWGSMDRQRYMSANGAASVDVSRIPTLQAAVPRAAKPAAPAGAKSLKSVRAVPTSNSRSSPQPALTDAQVLKILEKRRASAASTGGKATGSSDAAVLPPEDTNTRLALREAVAKDAPVSFAVQLQWSVQPIDLQTLPRHPIFRAYSLYIAEGRRAGRAWFFIRLGFFSDALSAKQVADYLRGEFASAAVVPVSPQEQQQVKQIGRCSDACTVARGPT